ncbi:T9SS type A sorting domain-containing protein [Winogradskyella echinorum]|uniref:T9SS type A sorting domain-containing protein n=1 Tax=Winogradskyella echinorum TaxID=538189 RepID=A0ABR6XWD7_9FLAO|nr:chondroitinase-B domain-containing protein [Winogradskyella echinorum]MBC3844794.1 T9SS type A sorting domain-containing protein [Winogradskyella echinorum]MBC5749142.1 T9SS type A sorting domain-containing protein [Winogradskyella echinorum]
MKKITFYLMLVFSISVIGQTTYNITDPEQLEDNTYVAGDEIILANGVYNTDERIDFIGNGTPSDPIIFRAETPGGVKFTGGLQMNIGGDYVIVDGFHWQGGYGASNFIQFRNGTDYANYSTIQNCVIDGLAIHPDDVADDIANNSITKHRWIVLYGTYNTVINCSFMNKASAGALVLAEYYYNSQNDPCAIVGHNISNNYFFNYEKIDNTLSNSGDSETIRIGSSDTQNVSSDVVVSNNYFVEADGENEIITNKSKGNEFINNTFRRCRGSLVLRHGSDATVDGNYFLGEDVEGTGGIRISDSNHIITNNYIQDCITVNSQAKWNNGITFLGGSASHAVTCMSTNTSNGYQFTENLNLSNNTIINTNAPLFYNADKGTTDPTGTVSNNLIYFAAGDPNLSDVISGDTPTSYADLGTSLTYIDNVYTGTTLGETNAGFSEENGITATADGEIFTFSGSGSSGKGANMGTYEPITDDMVGYGIGACFVDNLGASIIDGDCTIEVPESLTVGNLPNFTSDAGSNDVSVNANVSWTAVSNDAWISIDISAGTGDAVVSVSVTENTDTNSRAGTVTFSQDPGGDDIVRTLNVIQDGADLTDLYDLINDVPGGGPVSVHSFSQQQVEPENNRFNYATNTLDKVSDSHWTAQDGAILPDDYKGDGEYVIFDLGNEYDLDLIQIATDDKDDPYGLQIWVSTTGTDPLDFTLLLPASSDDLLITTTTGTDEGFDQYEITTNARYVKLMGFGRFNSAGTSRVSAWNNITEIEFFGNQVLSVNELDLENSISFYPMPAKDKLYIKNLNNQTIDVIKVFSLDGRKVIEKIVNSSSNEFIIDTSALFGGAYIVNLSNSNQAISKMIVISN